MGLFQDPRSLTLTLGNIRYFDMIDVGEALAHQVALAAIGAEAGHPGRSRHGDRLPFRRLARDPFTRPTYPLMLSVSTLTIRQSSARTTFLTLRRNLRRSAIARGGMLSLFPTGVFQLASVVPAPSSLD